MLVTHPGKLGDLLWSLATVKALSEHLGKSVDFATSPYCRGLLPLLKTQLYIGTPWVREDWQVEFSAPVKPWDPGISRGVYAEQIHLGLREWPSPTLVEYYPKLLQEQYGISVSPNFNDPWFYLGNFKSNKIVVAFSDEYAEAKAGALLHLLGAFPEHQFNLLVLEGSRMWKDFRFPFLNCLQSKEDLLSLAQHISTARLLISCNSAPHVLGAALGTPTIVFEPQTMRHQKVFSAPIEKLSYVNTFNSFELVERVREALG